MTESYNNVNVTNNEPITIFIKTLNRMTIPLTILLTETIDTIKGKCEEIVGSPKDLIRLLFNRKELKNEYTMNDYCIPDKSDIHILLNMGRRNNDATPRVVALSFLCLSASEDNPKNIEVAYNRLRLSYAPEHNVNEKAKEIYRQIQESYEFLAIY